jgi:DNA-binding transcriptional MerR regulator
MFTYDRPMTRSELARSLGVARTTLWNYEKAGLLPAPRVVSGKRSEFDASAQMIAADLVAGALA